jgi:hypothetical protein
MARVVALAGAAFAAIVCGASACATTPAFSATAVEPPTPGRALELRFELVNRTKDRQTLSIGAESIHIESVTRDGKPVTAEEKELSPSDNPLAQRGETLPIVEPDGLVAFFTHGGLSDLVLAGDVWHRRVFPLEHGRYRVTFSYQYRGTADGKPNLFTGRLVDKVRFDVE